MPSVYGSFIVRFPRYFQTNAFSSSTEQLNWFSNNAILPVLFFLKQLTDPYKDNSWFVSNCTSLKLYCLILYNICPQDKWLNVQDWDQAFKNHLQLFSRLNIINAFVAFYGSKTRRIPSYFIDYFLTIIEECIQREENLFLALEKPFHWVRNAFISLYFWKNGPFLLKLSSHIDICLSDANKATYSGFKPQRRRHQKYKTGVSMAPK